MTSFIVNLKTINRQTETIYLPSILLEKLNLKNKETVPIYFGIGMKRIVNIREINTNANVVIITSKLKNQLLLPYNKDILIKSELDGIKLGPIIGILTTDYTGKKFINSDYNPEHPFSLFFKNMLSAEPFYPAYYFVFTPENVDWTTKTVNGLFYSKSNKWEAIKVPLPDVVYNRVPNRTIEKKAYIENFKTQYAFIGGKLFNSSFFNKWDIYNTLVADENTKVFIPETYLSPTSNLLKNMIERHPIIYLKPANGSLGLGIYKIKNQNNKFLVQYRNDNTNKSLLFKDVFQLYKHIFLRKASYHYILQQGIDLIEYQQNPVDFRVHLHKNHLNKWQVIAIGSKVAGRGSVTTHLRTGGQLINALKYLELMFKGKSTSIIDKINESSILIAETLEKQLNEPLGELGLDIGIDKNQRIWLFEVNSKPGRSIFKHPSLYKAKMESNKSLIEYAIYLSNFDYRHK